MLDLTAAEKAELEWDGADDWAQHDLATANPRLAFGCK
jgi:hypothetical protein